MLRPLSLAAQSLALLTRWFAVQLITLDARIASKGFTAGVVAWQYERYFAS